MVKRISDKLNHDANRPASLRTVIRASYCLEPGELLDVQVEADQHLSVAAMWQDHQSNGATAV